MSKEFIRRAAAGLFRAALRASSRPYRPAARSVLVVAPHPDDEVLGCGGLIASHARAGHRIRVVFLTDGTGSHPGHPSLPQDDLGRRRRAEALEALAVLGADPGRADFLDLPDGGLDRLSPEAREAAIGNLSGILAAERPEEVFAPYRGGGSSEHTAALDLVSEAMGRAGGGRLLEYPIWAWWNPFRLSPRVGRPGSNLRLRLDGLRPLKVRALACHRTQAEPVPPWTEPVLPRSIAYACTGPEEFFFASGVPARQGPPSQPHVADPQ